MNVIFACLGFLMDSLVHGQLSLSLHTCHMCEASSCTYASKIVKGSTVRSRCVTLVHLECLDFKKIC